MNTPHSSVVTWSKATCPHALGLAVPAMPRGSPGMEADVKDSYDVLLIHPDKRYSTYARYAGSQR